MRVGFEEKAPRRAGRIQSWVRLLALCAWTSAGLATSTGQAASFSATLEPDTVAVGDTAVLKLVFEGSGQIQLSPIPNLNGLVVSGPEQGRSINIVNGQRTETVSVSYYLRPTQPGEFVIPSLTANIGGEQHRSPTLRLKAVQATQGGNSQSLALLRLVVPRETLYLGEEVVVELQLILRGNASRPTGFDMPSLSGKGWSAGQPMQGQTRQVQYGGQVATVYPIRIPITPLQSGSLTLGPVNSSVVVQLPSQPRRNDPFGGFDLGLFQRTEPRRVALSLPAHTLEVLPLPTNNVPGSFAGAIGQFDMSVSAGPTNVTVGDPVTLRVQISGTGNMSAVSLPDPLVQGDFKTYEPETKLDATDEFGLAGMKTVEQIIIPENTEVHEVPPIEFSYFDPDAGRYRTLRHPATPLQVMPAGSRPAPVVALSGENPPAAARQDIVHIKQRLDASASGGSGPALGPRFYLFNAAPLLAWLGVVAWRKRAETLGRNPRLRRRQEVRRTVSEGLRRLRAFSEAGEAEEFFATVFRLLQEEIGLVLDRPASGITESIVDEELAARDVDADTLDALHGLFQACDAARYAPTKDQQQLAALLGRLENALRKLEELPS